MHVTRYDSVTYFARITLTPAPAPEHAPTRTRCRLHLARLSPPLPYITGHVHAPPLPCLKTSMPEAVPAEHSGEAATVPPVRPAHGDELPPTQGVGR